MKLSGVNLDAAWFDLPLTPISPAAGSLRRRTVTAAADTSGGDRGVFAFGQLSMTPIDLAYLSTQIGYSTTTAELPERKNLMGTQTLLTVCGLNLHCRSAWTAA